MVVLHPRNAARRRFGNPNGPYYPPPNHGDEAHHGHHGPPPSLSSSSSRLLSQQSALLLLVGMCLGYLVAINVGDYPPANVGLDVIIKNLEKGRREMTMAADGSSSAGPMNTMNHQHRDAAALLRSTGRVNTADGRRRASSDVDGEAVVEDPDTKTTGGGGEADVAAGKPIKKNPHNTFREVDVEDEDLSEAQRRFIETEKLLSTQSIPTPTNPHVMKTVRHCSLLLLTASLWYIRNTYYDMPTTSHFISLPSLFNAQPNLPDSKRKKILITGGAGFVGSHLTDKLMMEGHEVIVLDNFFTGQRKNVEHWMHHPRFQLVVHDVTEPIMLEVDEIYHLACPASPPHYQYNPVKTIKTSTMGTINMLGLAKRIKAKILLTSTSEIYGDPQVHPQPESYWGNVNTIGPRACYDEGKRVAETMMYAYRNNNGVDVRVARIFNTFGPRMHPNDGRVVSNFVIQSLQDKPLTIYGDGSQTRSFQYISDLVDGLHALMNGGYDMPVNLGNPEEYTVKDFAEYIKEITGSASEVSFLPATKDDPTQRKPDITTAKRELGWEPRVTVKEGLQKTIAYFSRVLEESGEIIPTGQEASKPKPKVAASATVKV
ncbi:hypothetical protein ACHAW5_010634 [Stephanodiscus triporus]|uniref:UDP-glucuronate decarboxylase n=1 Tax=Stephanodiscus triporus TaxID=2934178 RepID=A0ABD3NZD7_9STRA